MKTTSSSRLIDSMIFPAHFSGLEIGRSLGNLCKDKYLNYNFI